MKNPSPLFTCASDGRRFYKAVMKRLSRIDLALSDLCREAGIEFSTAWRWNRGSKPDIGTVNTVEAVLHKLETRTHTTSSTSGSKPKASR